MNFEITIFEEVTDTYMKTCTYFYAHLAKCLSERKMSGTKVVEKIATRILWPVHFSLESCGFRAVKTKVK
jgi:hypothetical protein